MLARPRIRPLGLGELLDESFRLYRNNFLTFIAIAAVVLVPYTLLNLIVQIPLQQQIAVLQQSAASGNNPFGGLDPIDLLTSFGFFMLGTVGVSILYVIFFQPMMEGALAHAISQRYLDAPVGLGDSFGTALRRIFALIGARLIPALVSIIPLAIVFGGIIGIVALITGARTSGDDSSFATGIGAGLALFACIFGLIMLLVIASLLIAVRILFTSQAVIIEGQGPWQAIVRSWRLTTGSFWRILGYLLVIGLLVFFISLVPSLLITTPVQFLLQDQPQVQLVIQSVVSALVSVFITPFSLITYTLLYYDLRIRREGFDLEQLARQRGVLQGNPTPYGLH